MDGSTQTPVRQRRGRQGHTSRMNAPDSDASILMQVKDVIVRDKTKVPKITMVAMKPIALSSVTLVVPSPTDTLIAPERIAPTGWRDGAVCRLRASRAVSQSGWGCGLRAARTSNLFRRQPRAVGPSLPGGHARPRLPKCGPRRDQSVRTLSRHGLDAGDGVCGSRPPPTRCPSVWPPRFAFVLR